MRKLRSLRVCLQLGVLTLVLVGAGAAPSGTVSAEKAESPTTSATLTDGGTLGYTFPIRDDDALDEVSPAIAYNPDRQEYLIVWYNDRPGNDDIQGQRVSKGGAPIGGPFFISAGPGADRRYPDVAYGSGEEQYLVVWEHYESASGYSIKARRVSGNGQVLDITDREIRGSSNLYTPAKPAVAYASTAKRYLVVWGETFHPMPITYEIAGQRVAENGMLDGGLFAISQGSEVRQTPDVAYCRTRNEHLVVWRQKATASYDIHARRVAGAGGALGSDLYISTLGHPESDPAAAALPLKNGEGEYLVSWEIDTGTDSGVMARTIHVAGDATATLGLMLVVANGPEDEISPAVAGAESGGRYLMTWKQPQEVSLGGGVSLVFDAVMGRSITSDGVLLGGRETPLGGATATSSAVAAGPLGDFLVVFEDGLTSRGIYGRLWGNRVYLPLALRD